MFKKVFCITSFLVLFFCSQVFAGIETEFNNNDQSMNYKSTKKITKWSSVDWYEFVKHIEIDGSETYYIKMTISGPGMHKRIFSEKSILNIDGVNHTITKVPPSKYDKPASKGTITCYFNVNNDLIPVLAQTKNSIIITFNFDNAKANETKIPEKNIDEIIQITKLTRDNFRDVKEGKFDIK